MNQCQMPELSRFNSWFSQSKRPCVLGSENSQDDHNDYRRIMYETMFTGKLQPLSTNFGDGCRRHKNSNVISVSASKLCGFPMLHAQIKNDSN